ncbi:acyltransferase family protein [Microbacterium sp. KRD172]|uniref:acyltransferase family protein n=1 Tax=Microbacterium sp. KRD172 TaxID=2729727 RepID=UPI0019CF6ADE|nr:acyltransferase family protein [Microbacterium sp. KRD172]
MVSASPAKETVRFQLLDVCRFIAAFAVLVFHWLYKGTETGMMDTVSYSPLAGVAAYGYLGVYFFFMISGFVIANSARDRPASVFAVGRLVRLYPSFWVAVILTSITALLIGGSIFAVTIPQFLANLTMIPSLFDQPLVDRSYWTLFCEILFYGMVFVFLLVGLGKRLEVFYPAWALLMLVLTLLVPSIAALPLLGTLYAYFAAGAIIRTIHRRGWHWWQAVGLAASFYVAITFTLKEVALINDAATGPYVQSVPVTAVVVCGFFAVMLIQIIPKVTAWRIPKSYLLGALTYPLYLLHAHIGYMIFNRFADDENKWLIYSLALVLVLGLSYALFNLVEQRPKKMWVAFFNNTAGRILRPIERIPQRIKERRNRDDEPEDPGPPTIHRAGSTPPGMCARRKNPSVPARVSGSRSDPGKRARHPRSPHNRTPQPLRRARIQPPRSAEGLPGRDRSRAIRTRADRVSPAPTPRASFRQRRPCRRQWSAASAS